LLLFIYLIINILLLEAFKLQSQNSLKKAMSQHQARVPVKRLKQTALTWKVKDKATSQLARSDARLADRSQWRKSEETGRDCPPQSFGWGHSSVDSSQSSDFGGSVPGLAS